MHTATSQSTSASTHRYRQYRRHLRLIIIACALIATPLITITIGAASLSVDQVVSILLSHTPFFHPEITWTPAADAIVWKTRLPRIITSLTVGAILAVSGVILQAIVRNSLAEPYVLGVSSGASSGAAAALILLGLPSSFSVEVCAFTGALIATLAVLTITRGSHSPLHLILAGLAVGFGFQALTNLIIFSSGNPEMNQAVMFWMLGSLGRSSWSQVGIVTITACLITIMATYFGPVLDALASGDNTALSVGINPAKARLAFLIPTSAAVAIAVAAAGGIGFIGLIVPHIVRSIIGYSHRLLTIGSAMIGALFLTWTDAIARVVFAPTELPIGVITGLVGAPFLVLLVHRQKKVSA